MIRGCTSDNTHPKRWLRVQRIGTQEPGESGPRQVEYLSRGRLLVVNSRFPSPTLPSSQRALLALYNICPGAPSAAECQTTKMSPLNLTSR